MSERTLGQHMCRTAGIFQGITALPTMLIMGESALEQLFYAHIRIYWFITAYFTGFMAAGVLFVILVQRHPRNNKTSTYYLEMAKSLLATALWLWLLLDSIFGPRHDYYYSPPEDRGRKIIEAALCFTILPTLFYPTLLFAIYDKRVDEMTVDEESQPTEREPLLRR